MTDSNVINNIKKIKRKRKYIFGNSSRLRERKACPVCNSLDIMKRVITRDYRCVNCGWTGNETKKVMA